MFDILARLALKSLMLATFPLALLCAGSATAASVGQWYKVCQSTGHCMVRFQTTGTPLNSFAIVTGRPSTSGKPLAVALLSPDAILPFGGTWQIDQQAVLRIPFVRCNGIVCDDQLIINDRYIDALRHGSVLHLGIHAPSGGQHIVNINLRGFGSAYDAQ